MMVHPDKRFLLNSDYHGGQKRATKIESGKEEGAFVDPLLGNRWLA
jgi:hypothetical protein